MPSTFDDEFAASRQQQPSSDLATADDFDTGFANFRKQKQANDGIFRTSVNVATQTTPDKAAKVNYLSKVTGLPTSVVETNEGEATARAKFKELYEVSAFSPVLRQKLMDPEFTKIAQDDGFTLSAVEKGVRQFLDPTADDRKKTRAQIGEVGKYLAEGAKQLGMGATVGLGAGIADMAGFGLDMTAGVLRSDQLAAAAITYRQIAERAQESMDYFSAKAEGSVASGIQSGLRSAGTNLAMLPLGIAAGAEALAGGMAAMVGAQSYNKARSKGMERIGAATYAAPDAVFEYAFEKIPASRLLADIAKNSRLATMVSHQLLPEILGEQATTVLQDLNEWVRLNPQKTAKEFIAERPDAAIQTLVATLIGVGVQTGTVRGVQKLLGGASEQEARAKDAEVRANQLTDLIQVAMGSKLRERDPESFGNFVQQAAEASGSPLAEVHVDASVLAQVLEQSRVDQATFATMSPSAAEALPDALASGGSVAIPIGDLLGKLGDTGMEAALLPHLRAGEDALSQEEAKAEQAAAQQLLQSSADRILQQAQDSAVMQESADKVGKAMLDQLQAVGRFSIDVNRAYSTLIGSFYTVLGGQLGITPEQAYAEFPLRVQGVAQQGDEQLNKNDRAIVSPVDLGASPQVKVAQLAAMSRENAPVVDDFLKKIDAEFGTKSKSSFKTPENILSKSQRPSILAKEPWFGVEHVRDAFRFKTVLDDVRDLPKIVAKLTDLGATVVEADVKKVLEPREWGWRIAAFDLRMPNGQLVEYYLPVKELEQAKKTGNHKLFEKWRNKSFPLTDEKELRAYEADLQASRDAYQAGWDSYLARTGATESEVRAALTKAFTSVSTKTGEKSAASSSGPNAAPGTQVPSTSEAPNPLSSTSTLPSSALETNIGTSSGNDQIIAGDGYAQSARAEGDTRYTDRARELIAAIKPPARSAVSIMRGEGKVPYLPTNFAIARYFTRTDKLDLTTPQGSKAAVDALYADTLHALTDVSSAVGWYDRKVTAALATMAELHPEILTDEQAKFGFITMLAITSNSTKVNENFDKAEALYSKWKETGEWPTDVPDAKSADAMRGGLQKMQQLVAEHGWQKVRDFMTSDQTRADIEQFSGAEINSELADSKIYGAVFLGSKIGAFFNNLYGNFTPVTMDRWFMRTINRVRGAMLVLPDSFGGNLDKLADQINNGLDVYGADPAKLLQEIAKFKAAGKNDIEVALKSLPLVTDYVRARFNKYARDGYKLRTRENVLAKNIYESLTLDQQTPNGGGDRAVLRGVMRKLQVKLADSGIPIEMADLQAVLWYYEKDLFDVLKGSKRQAQMFGEATVEAEDYESAARRTVGRIRGSGTGPSGSGGLGQRTPAQRAADTTGDLFAQASVKAQPLVGLPSVVRVDGKNVVFGPHQPARQAAADYTAQAGIPYDPPTQYVKVDVERAKRIAQAYEDMPHNPSDPDVKAAYAALINETMAQWEAIKKTGLKVEFITGEDPYGNPRNAILDIVNNNHMWVYPTSTGFGNDVTGVDTSDSPMLAQTGETISGQPAVANDIFRVVHDYFGHVKEGVGFRADGEENAWRSHWAMFSPLARKAITTETRGQNSWVNFGPFAEKNKTASGADTVYAPQKVGLLPDWVVNDGAADITSDQHDQRNMRQAVDLAVLQNEPNAEALKQSQPGMKPGQVAITGVHFSTNTRTFLNGQYYGTGLKGIERERIANSADKRLSDRVYFYVDEGNGVRPESGVGGAAHEADLTNVYDIKADPLKLIVGGDLNATETNILNAGFDGYYVSNAFNQQGAAVLIGEGSRYVPVRSIANPTTKARELPAAPAVYKRGLLSGEIDKIDIAAIREVAPSAQLRAGTLQMLESEFPAAAEIAAQQGVTLPSSYRQGTGTRGTFNPKNLSITLLENADLSTFLHETGHFMLEAFTAIASRANAPVAVRQDMETLLGWFGVKSLDDWTGMTLKDKTPYHEKFAESFEQYLFEGKAPSRELQPLFQRFRAWFQSVYHSLSQFMRANNTQLNDEVRAVFDRMLATDEQIEQKQQEFNYQQMFATNPGSMSDQEFAAYAMANQMATGEAIDELQARSLRDLRWVMNARSRELKKLEKGVAEKRKGVETEVRAEIAKEPVYAVQRWLKTGVLPDGTKTEGAKLNTEDLREIFGDGPAAPWRYLATNMISNERALSLHPDVVAPMFGFTSGDQMVREIVSAYPEESQVQGLTDTRVLERFGDIASQAALDAAANDAVHNEYRAKALATELKALTQATQPVRLLTAAAKSFARQIIGRKRIKDIKPVDYERAEARAAKRVGQMGAEGKTQDAVTAKRDQVLQFHSAQAAREALEEARQARELFTKIVTGKDDVLTKSRDMDLVNATRAILANYGFGAKAKSAHDYLVTLNEHDPDMYNTIHDRVIAAELNGQPFNELSVDDMRALVDEVKSFWLLAKRSKQIEIDGKLVSREEAENALKERLEEIGVPDRVPGEGHAVTPGEQRLSLLQTFIAAARRVESWVEAKDGKSTGPFRKYVFNAIKDAADNYRHERNVYIKRFRDLLKTVEPSMKRGLISAPEIGYTFGMDSGGVGMGELLHALAHTGNDSNKRKLLLGRKWATQLHDSDQIDTSKWDAFVQRMIDEGKLTKVHFDFVQGVWDMLESTKPQAQKMHRDVFGKYFDEVTATPFVNQFGSYRGGYVPAMMDARIVTGAKTRALAEEENKSMAFAFPATNRGFTKSRVETNQPLMLDLRTLASHLDKVLLFSHMEGPIRDVRRLLTAKGVAYPINRIDPTAFDSLLTPWLNRASRQLVETPVAGAQPLMQFFTAIRRNAGIAAMTANVSNAAQQITGLSIAAIKVPPRHLLSAMASYIAHPKQTANDIASASKFMEAKMENEVAAMHNVINEILLDPGLYDKAKAWSLKHAYFLQSAVDNVISPIVWIGARNDALEQGMSDLDARRHADSVVRTTQGSTLPEDVSRLETGNAFVRTFTQFMGYFNMQANTVGSELINIAQDIGLKKGAGKALMVLMVGALAPTWIAEAIAQAFKGGPGDEDKDGWYIDDWLKAVFGYGTLRTAAAAVPVIGQLANAAVNAWNKKPYDDRIGSAPAVSMIESTVRSPVSVYNAIKEDGSKQKAVRDVATAISMVTGLPAAALARPLGYLAGVKQDKINPTGPVDAARGAITGVASPDSKH